MPASGAECRSVRRPASELVGREWIRTERGGWDIAGAVWAKIAARMPRHDTAIVNQAIQFRRKSAIANNASADSRKPRLRAAPLCWRIRQETAEMHHSPSGVWLIEDFYRFYALRRGVRSNVHHKCVFFGKVVRSRAASPGFWAARAGVWT